MRYSDLGSDAALALQYDALALTAIASILPRFIPWTESSLRPSAIKIILNDICLNRRLRIIEFGSGISTLFIAHMLVQHGGHLTSIEHDVEWIQTVSSRLPEPCRSHVSLVHAPLVSHSYNSKQIDWYDPAALRDILDGDYYDLVIVDGPPAYMGEMCLNRAPALALLQPKISPTATVVLDDINRLGEQWIAKHWSALLNSDYMDLKIEAGIALWRLGERRHVI